MKKQNRNYIYLAATLLLLLFAGQASAQAMRASLADANVLPADDPYCGSPLTTVNTVTIPSTQSASVTLARAEAFQSKCEDITVNAPFITSRTSVSVEVRGVTQMVTIPVGPVDWVLVEVRDATGVNAAFDSTVVARKPALLLSNGRVVDAEAYVGLSRERQIACLETKDVDAGVCPQVSFGAAAFGGNPPTVSNSAFLVVRHRNHIDIQSADPVNLISNSGSYDFAANATSARGGSTRQGAQKPATSDGVDVFAMFFGDASGDNLVTSGDSVRIDGNARGVTQYTILDTRLDGLDTSGDAVAVDGADASLNAGDSYVCGPASCRPTR